MSNIKHSPWIRVDANKYAPEHVVRQQGTEFHVMASPYDLPEAVRATFDRARNRIVFEFKYISAELGEEERKIDESISVFVSPKRHRVLRIEIDQMRAAQGKIVIRVAQALDALTGAAANHEPPRENIRVTRSVLDDKQQELLRSLPQPA